MTNHPQTYRISGLTLSTGTLWLKDIHQFASPHLPSPKWMRELAIEYGYPIKDSDPCFPVYDVPEPGLDFLDCEICFPPRCEPVIDNRGAPAA